MKKVFSVIVCAFITIGHAETKARAAIDNDNLIYQAEMTDEQIKQTLQQILDQLHQPDSGIFDNEKQGNEAFEIEQIGINKNLGRDTQRDATFALSGQEIIDGKYGMIVGCVGRAKAFLAAARDSGLDMKAVITTSVQTLSNPDPNQPFMGHVVVAVKMSDGQYHMIDPAHRQLQFLKQPAIVGETCTHFISGQENELYKIMQIISADELETIKTQTEIQNRSLKQSI